MTATRGTTNGNVRGSSEERRRRREWLVETFRADVDVLVVTIGDRVSSYAGTAENILSAQATVETWPDTSFELLPACRCYRCGCLLTADILTVDRIVPGCQGGTYRRGNIRPACATCNSVTGGATRRRPA